jgi:FkbM family methyltransferase
VVPWIEGTRLVLENWTGRRADVTVGLFEFEEMAFVLHALRPSSLFVDVGANLGLYTILGGGVVGASCLSLEPVPTTFEKLRENIQLNGLGQTVDARNIGVGAESGMLRFTLGEGAGNHVVTEPEGKEGVSVPVAPLDDLLDSDQDRATVLKIDVEGWEENVLRGAEQTTCRLAPLALIVELCEGERYGSSEADIDDDLREKGFKPVSYDPFNRALQLVDRHPPVGNTIYVNDIDAFAKRVAHSPAYHVMGQRI